MSQLTADQIRDAMQNTRGIRPEDLTERTLLEAGCREVVCVVPKDFRERASFFASLLAKMTMDTQGIKNDRLRLVSGTLAQALSYLMNSTSWQEGELLDFDYEELQRKLRWLAKP